MLNQFSPFIGTCFIRGILSLPVILLLSVLPVKPALALEHEATFRQLGFQQALNIRGVNGQIAVPFSVRADEVVTDASVDLIYNFSPALLEDLSHFNVIVNGEVVQSIPLVKDNAGKTNQRRIDIPIRLIAQFNRLNLELIGHYTLGCEDPAHSSLWLNVSNSSKLRLVTSSLPLNDDLSLLPAPFFDPRDRLPTVVPLVFGGAPNNATIEAAGTVASWLGGLASYRGYSFPVSVGSLPVQNNAIVFLLPGQSLPGVNLPVANAPRLTMMVHPGDASKKLLVVSGRDERDLKAAVQALVLGTQSLNGTTVTIDANVGVSPRMPYDAPRWVSSTRPTKFGDLVDPGGLQVSGQYPDLIRVPMTMPPDLFFWQAEGIPVHLKHRYTLRAANDKSTLNVSFSEKFIRAIPLRSEQEVSRVEHWVRNLVGKPISSDYAKVKVPREAFSSNGQLELYFHFDVPKAGECADAPIPNIQAAIDKESYIDISDFPKFMHMPELASFANSGYPFTRLADLSETAIVIPAQSDTATLSNLFRLLGRVGDLTGLPAYGFSLIRPNDLQTVQDKDLLLLGNLEADSAFKAWSEFMPITLSDQIWQVKTGGGFKSIIDQWIPALKDERVAPVASFSLRGSEPAGLMMGFESPIESQRSVVAIVGSDQGVKQILDAMLSPEDVQAIRGSVVYSKPGTVTSLLDEKTYSVGSLPILTWIRYYLSGTVWLNLVLLLGAALMFAVVFNRVLKQKAQRRLEKRS